MNIQQILQESTSQTTQTQYNTIITTLQPSQHHQPKPINPNPTPADITLLHLLGAITKLQQPKTYLEIGTRRGHSTCMIAHCATTPINIHSFDLFINNYANEPNPGPQHVQQELNKINTSNSTITFTQGNSTQTIPQHFKNNPQPIDLILIDGDHTPQGALQDLQNTINHLTPGGTLILHDITILPELHQTWNTFIKQHPHLKTHTNTQQKEGWALAHNPK